MQKIPIIMDCDTGTDDAIALVAALYTPNFDLRAVTTVTGNVPLKYTSRNTLNLVRYLGFEIPVAVGAAQPIMGGRFRSATGTHGHTGMGTVTLPDTDAPFYEKNAVETIIEAARALAGELILVPTGPITNIAQAILAYPELQALVKEIVFMGGAMIGGNVTPNAEFNAWVDPEALSIVLNSGIPCRMIGLDVTTRAVLDQSEADYFRSLESKAGILVADLLDFMLVRHQKGGEDLLMHDGLAVAVVAHPDIVRTQSFYVDCECHGTYTRGHTYVATNEVYVKKAERPALCQVALDLDLPKLKTYFREVIGNSVV